MKFHFKFTACKTVNAFIQNIMSFSLWSYFDNCTVNIIEKIFSNLLFRDDMLCIVFNSQNGYKDRIGSEKQSVSSY